ncbi:MAG TPA: glycine zipper 2TM domain-containing protein [Oxalicibacterium sp.]|uniref:glycine zipper 2TM domain-containing protein n=1 Tax=Oxalicibacterium sp. TaxID=2766525 RepID=UPI002C5A53B6|nr:glycine zipper 2TM domain-containing protein [Oxalicibacterium sp.]HWU98623.1 glycine zipper 2TM domain-containing protein [Oxalicibacterium sp.]
MKTNQKIAVLAIASAAILSGCGTPQNNTDYPNNTYPVSNAPVYNSAYGVVDSIQVVQASSGNSGVGGALVGGVVGGVVGNQIGGGSGRALATAAGAVGGALVGNQIQRNNQQTRDVYQVGVRLDNGAYQTMTLDSVNDLRVGDRVRIENSRVYRY